MIESVNQDQPLPSTYEWPYDSPRRFDWRSGIPDWHPGLGLPPDPVYVLEALDPAVLAARLELFEAEHKKVFDGALKEVQDGYKNRHWIWSVFPQAAGLPEHFRKASSGTSRKFSILCLDEAIAFREHPILSRNYLAILEAVRNQLGHRGLNKIFGSDAKKVVSSVTLFRRAARVCDIGSVADDEEPRTATRPLTEAERRYFNEVVTNAMKQLEEQQRPKNIEELLEKSPGAKSGDTGVPHPPFWPGFAAVTSREFVSPLGGVLIDHCDAILAKADDESLQPCSYSQEFGSSTENSWEWIGSGGSRVSPHVPFDEEEVDDAFDTRPWRGDAWSHRLVGGQ